MSAGAGERAIVTAAADSERVALSELRRAVQALGAPDETTFDSQQDLPQHHPPRRSDTHSWVEKLAPGIFLASLGGSFQALSARLRQRPPLFIRHIQPVLNEIAMEGNSDDLNRLAAAALELAPRLDPRQHFSVQTRLIGAPGPPPENRSAPSPYGRFEINERLSAAVRDATGAPLNVRAPEQVLSVLVTPTVGYIGLSRAEDNLSSWAGGAIRFAREPDQVSRAEFKLLEALSVFHLSLPEQGAALDLGAAPGGWTRLLRRAGLDVTAVDPGELDPRLAADPGIRHLRKTAQEFSGRPEQFDVIVNDMRMDARDSARLMLDFSRCLARDGLAVMTLKLPENAPEQAARRALDLLQLRYQLLGARQLYHNRSEITVALGRRDEG